LKTYVNVMKIHLEISIGTLRKKDGRQPHIVRCRFGCRRITATSVHFTSHVNAV